MCIYLLYRPHFQEIQVDYLLFHEFFKLHGFSKSIVSDWDSNFKSKFWKELFKLVGTSLDLSTSYHPQSDGKTKRVNQWFEGYLRIYVIRQQRACITWLHLGEFCYSTTFHVSIGMSPFKELYRYDAPTFVDVVFDDSRDQKEKDWIQ